MTYVSKESEKWCGINIPADTTLCYGFIFLSKSEELAAPRKWRENKNYVPERQEKKKKINDDWAKNL